MKGFRNIMVETEGEFGGLGLQVIVESGLIKVVAPLENTPAARAGILSGDIITHLDKQPTAGLALEEAVEMMRGTPNVPIRLTIQREGVQAV
jgi:carboxyl-terminal processing protease